MDTGASGAVVDLTSGARSAYRALASRSRVLILHELQERADVMGVDELAERVGLHPNTVREHLDRLVATGFAARQAEHRGTRGRPRLLYRAVARASGASMDARARSELTRLLVAGYGRAMECPADEAEAAGRRWADRLGDRPRQGATEGQDQLVALEQHFEDLGFDPELDRENLTVHLTRCPLRDLARERTDVVCSVHLGLARGVLSRQEGPYTADRLEAFVAPNHCILHLALTTPRPEPAPLP